MKTSGRKVREMAEKEDETGSWVCGSCWAPVEGGDKEKTDHLREEHPGLYGTLFLRGDGNAS
jgi:hypothetical protein